MPRRSPPPAVCRCSPTSAGEDAEARAAEIAQDLRHARDGRRVRRHQRRFDRGPARHGDRAARPRRHPGEQRGEQSEGRNAGSGRSRASSAFRAEQWNADLAVGLTGPFLCAKIIGGALAQQRRGVIVNISSEYGIIAPDQRLYRKDGVRPEEQPVKPVTYTVVKAGLHGLTLYLATYWADAGVRVNTITLGGVENGQPADFLERAAARRFRWDAWRVPTTFRARSSISARTPQRS